MEQKKLTAESLEKAETYIPLARKYAIAQILAPGCIERTESGFWRQNVIGRNLVGCYILAGFYLHLIDTSGLDKEKPEFQFTLEDFDRLKWLEREMREISEDLYNRVIYDFRDMQVLLNREITERLAEKNDLLNRLQEAVRLGLTPNVVRDLQKAVEAASPAGNGGDEG